jgi:hypothetical protein
MTLIILGAAILIIQLSVHGRRRPKALDSEYYQTEWRKILDSLKIGEAGWRLSVIDADKLLDLALQQGGIAGESLADRLRATEGKFSHYNDLWSAHKFRNKLVHEPNVRFTKPLAERILREYRRALKELGAFND